MLATPVVVPRPEFGPPCHLCGARDHPLFQLRWDEGGDKPFVCRGCVISLHDMVRGNVARLSGSLVAHRETHPLGRCKMCHGTADIVVVPSVDTTSAPGDHWCSRCIVAAWAATEAASN